MRKLIVKQDKKLIRVNDSSPAFSGNPIGFLYNFSNYNFIPNQSTRNSEEGWPYSDKNPDERH